MGEDTSTPAPAPSQSKPDLPVAEGVKDSHEPTGDASKEKWPFSEPKPLREDQIRNAVNFLSHPSVRGTPMMHRFSFLERKGLTREEIDEAFRRCPDPPTNDSGKSLVRTEGRAPNQPQSAGYNQMDTTTQPQPVQQYRTQHPSSMVQVGPTWSQLIWGAGLIAVAGAGTGYFFQKVMAPMLKRWLHDTLQEEKGPTARGEDYGKGPKLSPLEEAVSAAAAAANAAASAAAEVANTSREVLKLQAEEWQHFKSLIGTLDNKTEELKGTLALMSKNFQSVQEAIVSSSPVLAEDSTDYRGISKLIQRTPSLSEQVQSKQGVQSLNSFDKVHSNGHSANFTSYVPHSEDEPWWRRKKVEVETYSSPNKFVESTVQITEVDSELNQEIGSLGAWENTQNRGGLLGRPGWVPPPVPHTIMPGAASAIRYQKPAAIDEAKRNHVLEEKDMELCQTSGTDAFSTIRSQNAVSSDEAVKAKFVTEDPSMVNEAKPASSESWYRRPATVDGAEQAFTSDEKEARSQHPQPLVKAGSSGVSSTLRLPHSVNVDETGHTNVAEDALGNKANLNIFAKEKKTTFEVRELSEKVTDVAQITSCEPSEFSERAKITHKDKEAPTSSSVSEITEDVA